MQRTALTALDAERERAQREKYASLTAHYGDIGPAALLAALAFAQRKQDDKQQPAKVA